MSNTFYLYNYICTYKYFQFFAGAIQLSQQKHNKPIILVLPYANSQKACCYVWGVEEGKAVHVQAMKVYGRSRGTAPIILNLGGGWR